MTRFGIRVKKRKVARASLRPENQLYRQGHRVIAGLDEVGRGAWAGPVVAAAVILPRNPREVSLGTMFDSKNLSETQREQLRNEIRLCAVSIGIGEGSIEEINRLGLTKALHLAYLRALRQLNPQPEIVLLDGLPIKQFAYKHKAIVDGDQKSKCIAAASIVAKQYRDKLMTKFAPVYPQYGFQQHKGYGTEQHQQAILAHGILPIHRMRYGWLRDWQAGKRPQTQAAKRYFAQLKHTQAEPARP
ncbi:MAG: ribonuclease HII [Candidatus Andersenbacteria bacterium]